MDKISDRNPVTITMTIESVEVTHTRFDFPKGISFRDALASVSAARDELDRQVREYYKCPMSPVTGR